MKLYPFRHHPGDGDAEMPGSLAQALRKAWDDTVALLFRPFDPWRWVKLSVVCLVLSGGAPSAAFNWILNVLPGNFSLHAWFTDLREYLAHHAWLVVPLITLGLGVALTLLYVRAMARFVLVDAILQQKALLRQAWKTNRALGRSYFLFLLSGLATMGSVFTALAISSFPYLQSAAARGEASPAFSILLAGLLSSVVLGGALFALAITLTDDLVVPIMYVERLRLLTAWHEILRRMRKEPTAFAMYVLVRIGLSVVIGATVLFFLFPTLLAIFSGASIIGSLGLATLRVLGLSWPWNPVMLLLTLGALALLTGIVLIALSVAGMPGQVLIQNFGIRFIAPRAPALETLLSSREGTEDPETETRSA